MNIISSKKNFIFLIILCSYACSSLAVRDINSFTRNEETNYTSLKEYYIPIETIKKVILGITEEELYRLIDAKYIYNRFTYKQVLAKRLMKGKYIPVTKYISFYGMRTNIIRGEGFTKYEPVDQLGVAFFFYHEHLIYITINHREKINGKWIQLEDSTSEVLFAEKNRTIEEPLSIMATNAAGDAKYYGFVNGYLGEKISKTGERYFYPTVPLNNPRISSIVVELSKQFSYWESADYEVELQKSGYYQLKEKLDKDFENKTGYWEEKEPPR